MIICILVVIGLVFGSFINAYVWRVSEQTKPKKKRAATDKELSISGGRSMCPHCKHTLGWQDLIPVFSWLTLRGKCRYCSKKISVQYPLVELLTAALFVVSYIIWPEVLTGVEWLRFGLWLGLLVMLIALSVYDLKHMLLPNRMVKVAAVIVFAAVALSVVREQSVTPIYEAVSGLLAFGGLFYVLFQLSNGKWIGGGDVKLGFVLGAWLSDVWLSLLALFMASMIGTIIAISLMLVGKAQLKTRLPFGPMLIAATIIVTLYGQALIDAYNRLLIP